MDEHARHGAARREGGGKDVLEDLGGGAHHDDLPLEDFRRDLSADDARIGDAGEGARRTRVVDQQLRIRRQRRCRDAARLGEAIDLKVESRPVPTLEIQGESAPAHVRVVIGDDVHGTPGSRALANQRQGRIEVLLLLDPPLLPHFAEPGREHDPSRARDGLGQGLIILRPSRGRLEEQDVERDGGGFATAHDVDELGVERPRPGPGDIELGEGVLVDGDDDNGRLGIPEAPQRELLVQGLELDVREESRDVIGVDQRHGEPDEAADDDSAPGDGTE